MVLLGCGLADKEKPRLGEMVSERFRSDTSHIAIFRAMKSGETTLRVLARSVAAERIGFVIDPAFRNPPAHVAVALEVLERTLRLIDWQLMGIGAAETAQLRVADRKTAVPGARGRC